MAMRQYSADQVEISWQGLDFNEGLATGTFQQEAQNTPKYSTKVGKSRNSQYRTRSTDRSGTNTLLVDMESQLHQDLVALSNTDDDPGTATIVGKMTVKDLSTGEIMEYENSFIQTDADQSKSTEPGTASWVFAYGLRTKKPVDSSQNTNLVGT